MKEGVVEDELVGGRFKKKWALYPMLNNGYWLMNDE